MNFKLPKIKSLLTAAGVLFLSAGVLAAGSLIQTRQNINKKAVAATNLYFSPQTQQAYQGEEISFAVAMDTGSNNVTGLDVLVNFDTSVLEVVSIEKGSGIIDFDNIITNYFDNSQGTIGYTAFVLDKNKAVKGSGVEVLKIKANIKDNSNLGVHNLVFDATSAISATNESQNALTESSTGTINVKPKPTPIPTALPTNPPGNPNSCGGTCGSNNNCESNLTCYQGYCRNPSCSWSKDCSCTGTPLPTPAPTNKPVANVVNNKTSSPTSKPQVQATPVGNGMVVVNLPKEPEPTTNSFWEDAYSNENTETEQQVEETELQESANSALPWIIGSLVAAGITLVLIAFGLYKYTHHKNKPPVIRL